MKMKTVLIIFAFIAICVQTQAQTVVGRQNVDQFPTDASGTMTYGLTWLPPDYSTNPSKKFPLIIFLHGSGEVGTGIGGLSVLINAGLPARIAAGFNPAAVNPLDGQTYEFIVCSPQNPSWSYNYDQLKYILPNILSRYRVDLNRVYLTGLSAGGDGVNTCLGSGDGAFLSQIAAAATSSSAGVDAVNGLADVQVEAHLRQASKPFGVRVWTVAGDQDFLFGTDVRYHDSLNITNPSPPDKLTIISGVGHSTWNQQYDSAFRPTLNYYGNTLDCTNGCAPNIAPNNNGSPVRGSGRTQDSLNVYEWFLLSTRGSAPLATPPTSNAGSTQTITLPTSSVTLNGSATAGGSNTITSYAWSLVSGPNTPAIVSAGNASTAVNGLIAGTYVFQLSVTQSDGETATSTVTITVNGSIPTGGPYASPVITVGGNQSIATTTANTTSAYTLTGASLSTMVWTKFSVPGETKKKIGILGSSTSQGNGASTYDSAYAGRLQTYYQGAGIIDSVVNLAYSGYNIYQAMPTGYVPPASVTAKLSPSDVPDPTRNITALLAHHPDVIILCFPSNGYDVLTTSEIMTPMQTIYDLCTAAGVQCYVTTTQPRFDQQFSTASQNFLKVLRDSILNRFGSHAIDFYDCVATPGTTVQMPQYMYGDSIHLNDAGHQQLFNMVVGKNIFQNLISSSSVIASPSSNNTSITGLPTGVNKFQATVIDSHGQAANAVTSITVTASGPVTASAGSNQTITLPTSSVTLDGSGSTGSITSYSWTLVSGPNT
ncbi:MAG: GDSL-type esterase/lipase family protein, partial [Bacteroidota bacterium]|nr:GDSL-type esterase/lipase family protein [Bacteroidota bacterium]